MRFFIAFGFLIFSCAYSLDILCQKRLEMQQKSLKIVLDKPDSKGKKELLEKQIEQTKKSCSNESVLAEAKENIKNLQERLDIKKSQEAKGHQIALEKELLHRELIAAKMELLELEALLKNP